MGAATAAVHALQVVLQKCRRRPARTDEDEPEPGYEGQIHEGLRHGYGKLRLPSGASFEGQWDCSAIRGEGTWIYPDDSGRYVGQWLHNKMHGKGKLHMSSGAMYVGQWLEGRFHLKGDLESVGGTLYSGQWRHGREHGNGKLNFPDGKMYEGQWVKGEVKGRGTLSYPDERKQYVGQFAKSKPHGHGQLTYADGATYVGQWEYGVPTGRGRWREAEGEWIEAGNPDPLVTPLSSVRASLSARQGMPKSLRRQTSKGTARSGTSAADSSLAMSVDIIQRFNSDPLAVSYLRERVSEHVLYEWAEVEEKEEPQPHSPASSAEPKSTEKKLELRPVSREVSRELISQRSQSLIDYGSQDGRSPRTLSSPPRSRASSKEMLSTSRSLVSANSQDRSASSKEVAKEKEKSSRKNRSPEPTARARPAAAMSHPATDASEDAPSSRSIPDTITTSDNAVASTIGRSHPSSPRAAPREMTGTSWGESCAPTREPTGIGSARDQSASNSGAARDQKFGALDAELGARSQADLGLPRSGRPAVLRPIPKSTSEEQTKRLKAHRA